MSTDECCSFFLHKLDVFGDMEDSDAMGFHRVCCGLCDLSFSLLRLSLAELDLNQSVHGRRLFDISIESHCEQITSIHSTVGT